MVREWGRRLPAARADEIHRATQHLFARFLQRATGGDTSLERPASKHFLGFRYGKSVIWLVFRQAG
jgi:hypothetical protein